MLTFLTRSKIGVDFDGKIDASISQEESFLFFPTFPLILKSSNTVKGKRNTRR